jgi:RNA recognition motif-containing protein
MHDTDFDGRQLLVRLDRGPKGKGSDKGSGKGYGKGYGKDFGKGYGKDFGKGNGKGFDKGKGKKGPKDISEFPENCHSVIVKNLSYGTEEHTLEDVFQDCGEIEGVKLLRDRDTGRSRGVAFVDFKSPDGAKRAMDKFDQMVDGRSIFVDWSNQGQ